MNILVTTGIRTTDTRKRAVKVPPPLAHSYRL